MGRSHPEYCEHGKCIESGDESFGLLVEDCDECDNKTTGVWFSPCGHSVYPDEACPHCSIVKIQKALREILEYPTIREFIGTQLHDAGKRAIEQQEREDA